MAVTPQTIVYLCHVPLEIDQKNQLDFATAAAQYTYFYGTRQKTYTSFTYQRKDNILRVPDEVDKLHNCNYVMYQNADFDATKWFYAFIESREYVNPNCTALKLKTDVWQTWMFQKVMLPSMIERQTTASDTYGEFCEPEPVSATAYPVDRVSMSLLSIAANPTFNPILYFSKLPSATLSRTPTAVRFNSGALTMQYASLYTSIDDSNLTYDLNALETAGEMDLINDIGIGLYSNEVVTQITSTTKTFVSAPLTPKNNKSYNYCYGVVTGSSSYKLTVQELHKHTFDFTGDMWWGSSPFCYAVLSDIPNKIVEYNSFPSISVTTSTYENAINRRIAEINNTFSGNALIQFGQSVLNLKPAEAIRSIAGSGLSALDLYNQRANATLEPDSMSGGSSSASILAGTGGIWLVRYAPKPEDFKRIDDFFSMFGYAINQIKTPSYHNRTVWDYIKTINVDISGNIPQEDVDELKAIFNNGVTVWHSAATFGDYSQLNTIIS